MAKLEGQACYMCREPATTREHVPPQSFFVEPHDKGLSWVPSCEKHNNANSLDVEYARTIIPTAWQTNELAREIGAGKVLRMFERRPRLLERFYKDATPIFVNGQETVAHGIEFDRLRRVMEAIAYGMYLLRHRRRFYGNWWFYSPDMVSMRAIREGRGDGQQPMREAFDRLKMNVCPTPHPQVFECAEFQGRAHEVLFRFRFYEGFTIYARGVLFHQIFEIPNGAF